MNIRLLHGPGHECRKNYLNKYKKDVGKIPCHKQVIQDGTAR